MSDSIVHEARPAAAVAAFARGLPRATRVIRVRVTGGDHEPAAFDAALRLNIAAAAPELAGRVVVDHVVAERLCVACGGLVATVSVGDSCPSCGEFGYLLPAAERIEIEAG